MKVVDMPYFNGPFSWKTYIYKKRNFFNVYLTPKSSTFILSLPLFYHNDNIKTLKIINVLTDKVPRSVILSWDCQQITRTKNQIVIFSFPGKMKLCR